MNLDRDGVKKMGESAPKFSLMIKFFMRYFLSPEKIMRKAGEIWSKHYTAGNLEPVEKNGNGNYIRANLYDVDLHPIMCDYLSGYFASVVKMGVGKETKGEEVKCVHNGDEHHEFIISW